MSETIILRTYPLKEADLIVSFLTRDHGKLRGVAKRARKPGSRFGSGLERLSHIRLFYFARENRDLATLDSCELIGSRFGLSSDYGLSVGLDFMAEVSEHLLPANEINEKYFRLLLSVTDHLLKTGASGLWPAVNYFTLWAVRLTGILSPVHLSDEDRAIAEEMLRKPVGQLEPREWSRQTLHGLRCQLVRLVEDQVERKLLTTQYLETI